MTTTTVSKLLSIPSTAEALDCSRAHVYRLIAAGELTSVQIKTPDSKRPKTRVKAEDLEAFIAAHTVTA